MRPNSVTSLRSDGSDSEVLNRLEHLKRQLKDKEARLQEHVVNHQNGSNAEEKSKMTYQPPSQPPVQRKASPAFMLNAARVHHRDSPTNSEKMRQMFQTDEETDFKPNYFRDDAVLMGGNRGKKNDDYYSSSKRVDSGHQMFVTNTEKEANRRHYGQDQSGFYDEEDPTSMANFELNVSKHHHHRYEKSIFI
jgi:hypothetical protein